MWRHGFHHIWAILVQQGSRNWSSSVFSPFCNKMLCIYTDVTLNRPQQTLPKTLTSYTGLVCRNCKVASPSFFHCCVISVLRVFFCGFNILNSIIETRFTSSAQVRVSLYGVPLKHKTYGTMRCPIRHATSLKGASSKWWNMLKTYGTCWLLQLMEPVDTTNTSCKIVPCVSSLPIDKRPCGAIWAAVTWLICHFLPQECVYKGVMFAIVASSFALAVYMVKLLKELVEVSQ